MNALRSADQRYRYQRYSDSIDGDFVIGPHPDYKNLLVACGDSGHGLK